LPVGENLQDQVMADGIEMFTPYSGFTVTAARAENLISAWAYSIFGTGRLTDGTDCSRNGFTWRWRSGNFVRRMNDVTYVEPG